MSVAIATGVGAGEEDVGMRDSGERPRRKEAKRNVKKHEEQGQIMEAVQPFLQPAERVLCGGAPGTYSPRLVFAVPNQVVRRLLAIPLLPLWLVTQGDGVAARFVVADSRLIILKRFRHKWITSVPMSEINSVTVQRGEEGIWVGAGSVSFEVVEMILLWRERWARSCPGDQLEQQPLRVWFKEPWLSEGEAIANAIRERVAAAGNEPEP